jgi:hypothetical protein
MPKQEPKYNKFSLIINWMPKEFREKVVADVLSKRGSYSRNIEDRLRKTIKENINIDRARKDKVYAADSSVLLPLLLDKFKIKNGNGVAEPVLLAWQDCNKQLREVVDGHLAMRDVIANKNVNQNEGFRSTWKVKDIENAAIEILKTNLAFEWDDVRLMLFIARSDPC